MYLKQQKYNKVYSNVNNYKVDDVIDFKKYLKGYKFNSVFEVGCGNGRNLNYFFFNYDDGIKLRGCDISDVAVEQSISHGFDVIKCCADKIPIYDEGFDVVLTVHSLEQMKYIVDDVIKEIYRLCNRYVFCFEPVFCLQNIWGRYHNFMNDYVKGLPFLLEKHGFEILECRNLGIGRFNNRTCLVIGEKS